MLLNALAGAGGFDPEQASIDEHPVRHAGIGPALKLEMKYLIVSGQHQIGVSPVGVDLREIEFGGSDLGFDRHSDPEDLSEQVRIGVDEAFGDHVVLICCRRDGTALPMVSERLAEQGL
ncbi:hypothetical protein Q0Z83_084500 [Actinoplanes sichuanensis]|nr:hypothetical protein Q0Z83_084500 [Actinoplanes sichuanensis]